LHRFGDIALAGFCAPDPTPIPSYFGGVPVGLDHRCWGQPEHVLFGCEIIFEVFQPMWSLSTNVTVTHRQTDARAKCYRKTALCTVVHRVVKM